MQPCRRTILLVGASSPTAVTLVLDATAQQPAPAAAKLPKLPLDNAQAKALSYTDNAASVKHPSFKAGSHCANCNLYKGAKGDAYGPCQIFPQHSVAAKGWCSAWVKKA